MKRKQPIVPWTSLNLETKKTQGEARSCKHCDSRCETKAYDLYGKKTQLCDSCAHGLEHSTWEPNPESRRT